MDCPDCKSVNLSNSGMVWRKCNGIRTKVQRKQCNDCGRIFVPPESLVLTNPTNNAIIKSDTVEVKDTRPL
jgi:uncharacterized OB-fold protein